MNLSFFQQRNTNRALMRVVQISKELKYLLKNCDILHTKDGFYVLYANYYFLQDSFNSPFLKYIETCFFYIVFHIYTHSYLFVVLLHIFFLLL